MTPDDPTELRSKSNGRKTALLVLAVAFIASVTTVIFAISESHRVLKSDAAALSADTSELRAVAADWSKRVAEAQRAPREQQAPLLDEMAKRSAALLDWQPRTPCGQQSQTALQVSMDTRVKYMKRVQAQETVPEGHIDENAALEQSLQRCEADRGRDVNV